MIPSRHFGASNFKVSRLEKSQTKRRGDVTFFLLLSIYVIIIILVHDVHSG